MSHDVLQRARVLYHRADDWHNLGRFRDADAAYATSTEMLRPLLGDRSPELADVVGSHAETRHQLGDFQGALTMAGTARAMLDGVRGDEHGAGGAGHGDRKSQR